MFNWEFEPSTSTLYASLCVRHCSTVAGMHQTTPIQLLAFNQRVLVKVTGNEYWCGYKTDEEMKNRHHIRC